MNWMMFLDILMGVLLLWLVGHIFAGEYIHHVKPNDIFAQDPPSTFWERLGSLLWWWYVLLVLDVVYFYVRSFG